MNLLLKGPYDKLLVIKMLVCISEVIYLPYKVHAFLFIINLVSFPLFVYVILCY
jgi:hypothetical protein